MSVPTLPPKWRDDLDRSRARAQAHLDLWGVMRSELTGDTRGKMGQLVIDAIDAYGKTVLSFDEKYRDEDILVCEVCGRTGIEFYDHYGQEGPKCPRCESREIETITSYPFMDFVTAAMTWAEAALKVVC